MAFRKAMYASEEPTLRERTRILTCLNVCLHRHRTAFVVAANDLVDASVLQDLDAFDGFDALDALDAFDAFDALDDFDNFARW